MTTALASLEDQSLWYKYKLAVWHSRTPQATTVHNIMRTLRSIRGLANLAYVSVPITSGKYLFELRQHAPHLNESERMSQAINHNYLAGLEFVGQLVRRLGQPVLYPADLTPVYQEWEQTHFQALWLEIIAEKCTELHLSEGWQFSNGGCEEFTHVMQLRLGPPKTTGNIIFYNTKEDEAVERERMRSITVYDHTGRPIDLQAGMNKITDALQWITAQGFAAPRVERCAELLRATAELLSAGYYQ